MSEQLPAAGCGLFCGSGLTYLPDGVIDYSVEKLVMVGLGLDLFTNLLTCFGSLGKREVAILGRDHSQLLNDIEEGILASCSQCACTGRQCR